MMVPEIFEPPQTITRLASSIATVLPLVLHKRPPTRGHELLPCRGNHCSHDINQFHCFSLLQSLTSCKNTEAQHNKFEQLQSQTNITNSKLELIKECRKLIQSVLNTKIRNFKIQNLFTFLPKLSQTQKLHKLKIQRVRVKYTK